MSDNIEQNVNQAQTQEQEQQQQGADGLSFVPGDTTQIAVASNENTVVGNIGAVTTGPQSANAINVAGLGLGACGQVLGLTLTSTVTSLTPSTDPVTGATTETRIAPLFTTILVTPAGVGNLPIATVIVINPPMHSTAQATSVTTTTDPITGDVTRVIVTPAFTLSGVTPPGIGNLPTITLTTP